MAEYSYKYTGDLFDASNRGDTDKILELLNRDDVDLNAYDFSGRDFLMLIAMSPEIKDEKRADILGQVLNHDKVAGNKELLGMSNIKRDMIYSPVIREFVPVEGGHKQTSKKSIMFLYHGAYEITDKMSPPAVGKDEISSMIGKAVQGKAVPEVVAKTPDVKDIPPVGSIGVGGAIKKTPDIKDIPPVGSIGVGSSSPVTQAAKKIAGGENTTSALFAASRNGNVDEVLRLLDNPEVKLNAFDMYGKDFLMSLAVSKKIPQGKLAETMQKVLNHPKVNGNEDLFAVGKGNKKNIADLYRGAYANENIIPSDEDKDAIAVMIGQARKGQEVTGKLIGGASGAKAKTEATMMQKVGSKVALGVSSAVLLGTIWFGASGVEKPSEQKLPTEPVVEQVQESKWTDLFSFLKGKEKIKTPEPDKNPAKLFVPEGVSHPGFAPNVDNDFSKPIFKDVGDKNNIIPDFTSQGAVESVLNKMAENPANWSALNHLYTKGNLAVEVMEDNDAESGYKAHIGDQSGTFYIDNIGRWYANSSVHDNVHYKTELEDPAFIAFSIVAKVHMDHALSNPELLKTMENNYSNTTNAQKMAAAYGNAKATTFLGENGMLNDAYFINDRLEGNKAAFGVMLGIDGDMNREDVPEYVMAEKSEALEFKKAFIASFFSSQKSPNTHSSTDGIISMHKRTDMDFKNGLIFRAPWNMPNEGEVLKVDELLKLMPEEVQNNIGDIKVDNLMKMPRYLDEIKYKSPSSFENALNQIIDKAEKDAGVEGVLPSKNNRTVMQMVQKAEIDFAKEMKAYEKSSSSWVKNQFLKPNKSSSTVRFAPAFDKKGGSR